MPPTTLNPEQKRKYIQQGGVACPFCGSRNMSGDAMETNAHGMRQNVHCDMCLGAWVEVSVLVGKTLTLQSIED